MGNTQLNDTRLSSHFKLGEFLNLVKPLTSALATPSSSQNW